MAKMIAYGTDSISSIRERTNEMCDLYYHQDVFSWLLFKCGLAQVSIAKTHLNSPLSTYDINMKIRVHLTLPNRDKSECICTCALVGGFSCGCVSVIVCECVCAYGTPNPRGSRSAQTSVQQQRQRQQRQQKRPNRKPETQIRVSRARPLRCH